MKKHKLTLSSKSLKMRLQAVKFIVITVIIFLAIVIVIGYARKILTTLDYFKIRNIIVKEDNNIDVSYLEGHNILGLDLQKEARCLLEFYPNYQKIRLVRLLPNRLFIDAIKRQPLGLIKLYRYFSIDKERVLFEAPRQLEGLDLPLILGLETKILGPKLGKQYDINELILALDIIKEAKTNKVLKDYKIKEIDVKNPSIVSFFIFVPLQVSDYPKGQVVTRLENLEIKIGQDDIKGRINILSTLLIQLKNDLANIKYIDLRFKEPVIKFK